MLKRNFDTFGVMIDMSRNSVMSVSALKKFLTLIAKIGYNCVMLYTEDTYEIDDPYFGYLRGKYSKEELKEIDGFADALGIEIIPCIQTLAHMNTYIKWNRTPIDCNDILLTDDERTYTLIDKMISSLSECFKSRRIHIGMDEAHMLGRGRHLDIHGYESSVSIMKRHLARVSEITKKYGYTPLMWSDMFFRSWNNGVYTVKKQELPKEIIDSFPNDVIPIYWDYYRTDKSIYDGMMYNHIQLSDKTWFAGGVWGWGGFIPFNELSIKNMLPAIDSCCDNGIRNAFITLWGDDGGECSHFSQLPALFMIIEYAKGNFDENKSKEKFKRIFGLSYDDFIAIDLPNQLTETKKIVNPSKYMLYSDPFAGFLDYTVSEGAGEIYDRYSKRLSEISKKSKKYGYIFKAASKLCSALSVKYELGVKTRRAYRTNDKDALILLISEYDKAIKLIDEFYNSFSAAWYTDYKPQGFEVQEIRIGGIIQRLCGCKKRLQLYINGKIEKIDELEEDILPYGKNEAGEPVYLNNFSRYASVNSISY